MNPRSAAPGSGEIHAPAAAAAGIGRSAALKFVLLLGVVSLFADMTYGA